MFERFTRTARTDLAAVGIDVDAALLDATHRPAQALRCLRVTA